MMCFFRLWLHGERGNHYKLQINRRKNQSVTGVFLIAKSKRAMHFPIFPGKVRAVRNQPAKTKVFSLFIFVNQKDLRAADLES